MNIATENPRPPGRPRTLGEFNALLAAAGLERLSADGLAAMRERRGADDLARAARQAATNPNARAYLAKAMAELRLAGARAPRPAPDPPVPPPVAVGSWPRSAEPSFPSPLNPERDTGADAGGVGVEAPPEPGRTDRLSVHVYGSGAALCFEADRTRRGGHTIALDAARATGPRAYDWGGKIRLQMTLAELPVVAGVFLGRIERCEYGNHGPENDKGFSLENQDGKIFARVFAKGKSPCAVPIGPEDAYRVTALAVRQLRENTPWLAAGDVVRLVTEVVARLRR